MATFTITATKPNSKKRPLVFERCGKLKAIAEAKELCNEYRHDVKVTDNRGRVVFQQLARLILIS